ncbi:energy transducer TonB [Luteimonas sp. MC1572]|uniref:energy transducer TonB n=1 Tax=Luteimonas sp. MC1572 TaxID=2799325 RepID=UPI0018F0C530|nr:energy transducer TonB [Luteimonas sp. MC1572]MBJ6980500.1 energy transducer TonB [Luteimonas sp. MC1572]QQO04377.1 energy transducer TonB [Luteimonas sp. MC1572]
MSDPNPPPAPRPPADPRLQRDTVSDRKSASPLIWILLLLAVLAFGWYVYNQRGSVSSAPEPAAPPAIDIGDSQDAAAERERAADEARQKKERDRQAEAARAPAAKPPSTRQPDREATPITRVEPTYPATAYRAREEGTVLVTANVDASGVPLSVDVARRSGSRALDQAAVAAVRQWRFEPAMRGGKAVASTVEVPVSFRLDR